MHRNKSKTNGYSYETLRARLIERGVTLRSFARDNSIPVQTVYSAAKRQRNGVKSVRILKQLEALAA